MKILHQTSKLKPSVNKELELGFPLVHALLALLASATVILSIFLHFNFSNYRRLTDEYRSAYPLPSLSEVAQNLQMAFHGYSDGYLRTLYGYIIFLIMASSFLFLGKLTLDLIVGRKKDGSDEECFSLSERVALSYVLGSLVMSLLWLGIGALGGLHFSIAVAVPVLIVAGISASWIRFSYAESGRFMINPFTWFRALPLLEKSLWLLFVFILLALSTPSISQPQYADTLLGHAALPGYYIQQGRVVSNPYHIYSYFTQNMEMLVMWAFLLKSEIAAGLLPWGFYAATTLLIFGFTNRLTNSTTAIAVVFVFLSSATIALSGVWIKPDISSTLFIVANYVVLIKLLDLKAKGTDIGGVRSLALLGGLIWGGAVGHKLIAAIPIFFSTVAVFGMDAWHYRRDRREAFISPIWVVGGLIAISPWLIKNLIEVGNPFYPFLNSIFGSHLDAEFTVMINRSFADVKQLYRLLLLGLENPRPSWGPTLLFALPAFFVLGKSQSIGVRLSVGAALLSELVLLRYGDPRYHMGVLSFLVCVPFAVIYARTFSYGMKTYIQWFVLVSILLALFQTYRSNQIWTLLRAHVAMAVSGSTLGNFDPYDDDEVNKMRWTHYLIKSRTARNEGVVYSGIYNVYGLDRKTFFSYPYFNKDVLCEASRESSDATELGEKLKNMGIGHILMSNEFYNIYENIQVEKLRLLPENRKKIEEMLIRFMVLTYDIPDGTVLWYSFKDKRLELNFTAEDARKFPIMYIREAQKKIKSGDRAGGEEMLKTAVQTPMTRKNKANALHLLGQSYSDRGDMDRVEDVLFDIIELIPELPESYINLSSFYMFQGPAYYEKSLRLAQKAMEIGPDNIEAQINAGKVYIALKRFEEAKKCYRKAEELRKQRI